MQRKVSTLILLQSKDLLNQWVDELGKFLDIKEELPKYETKSGRVKKRDSVIGILHGSKNTLTGIVDVVMVGSMYSKGKFNELINSYGMVIMESHDSKILTKKLLSIYPYVIKRVVFYMLKMLK